MKKLTFILLLFATLTSFAGNNDREKKTTIAVSGKVKDSKGELLPGTKITVKETGETFFADQEGNFFLTLKSDQAYSLCFDNIGFAPEKRESKHLGSFSEVILSELP
jgi:hypothetical protein